MVKNVAIIGAGPAGLSAAYQLSRAGLNVVVYEAGSSVGGMAKTIELWGQLVDLGPHRFFSDDARVNSLWLEVLGRDYEMVNRLTRIYYKNTFFAYPLKPLNALIGLGLFESIRCIASYCLAQMKPNQGTESFDQWVTNRFGARLFEIFFKSYSEKLWGINCKDLDSDFAAQRIKKLSLLEAIKNAMLLGGGTNHKTLVDEFAYPARGAGYVYDLMAKAIIKNGGKIRLNTPVVSVCPAQDNATGPSITLQNEDVFYFDHIISTMPITHLVRNLKAPADIIKNAASLKFRNTILVYLRIACRSPFPDQWIYVHANNLATGRITNFSNWIPGIKNGETDTILCMEYWCNDEDNLWTDNDETLVELATREIYQTRLIPEQTVCAGTVVRVPKCYPVYSKGYKEDLRPIEDFLSKIPDISAIGRYGAFKYNNQDHSILMGILSAENLTSGAQHNLWELNTDYEYQEATQITATGLRKKTTSA